MSSIINKYEVARLFREGLSTVSKEDIIKMQAALDAAARSWPRPEEFRVSMPSVLDRYPKLERPEVYGIMVEAAEPGPTWLEWLRKLIH